VKNSITFENYKKTLYENEKRFMKYNAIRAFDHQLYSVHCSKVGLSSFDSKRFWTSQTKSLAYGHWRIGEEKEEVT
jgi:hypothetical protein